VKAKHFHRTQLGRARAYAAPKKPQINDLHHDFADTLGGTGTDVGGDTLLQ
jgi:hypothetical protein